MVIAPFKFGPSETASMKFGWLQKALFSLGNSNRFIPIWVICNTSLKFGYNQEHLGKFQPLQSNLGNWNSFSEVWELLQGPE